MKVDMAVPTMTTLWYSLSEKFRTRSEGSSEAYREVCAAYGIEISTMLDNAQKAKGEPVIRMSVFGGSEGGQMVAHFSVSDVALTHNPSKNNWHGQNTSQWLYAGALVVDERTGEVSTHH